ncbi:tRNA (adenosine(37)-N6)-threonylcarbamoyltransferase complex ATPase subunit type 1 TsaE [Acidipila sp. EB88]|uniref:tRNA (adenosine(37)-N6)-threonylcarbamoyltransferase complex ATPase subunit type 1 TsaE n=1 Tax=Acidipila sp. EB88 TaxID=2305226 RepID=UPI000F5FA3E0|nr:tRNA (adenosine(37)-N6)-threonylcarbamoyltransferase complex ATPase subunit type 1 TsaE [Acidipila sp. EB88]RRA48882.1 tRNA (adenosine(37)-N6)-threonylcarbamoyltransferase complex ATPase subunit type 1 TsaE [Acidipila sp. EB88]
MTEELATRTMEFHTENAAETIRAGAELLKTLQPPVLMILTGTLGAGKTTLVKGIADALGAAEPDEVTSPTFTLMHEYEGSLNGKPVSLYHLDLYRLESERQVEQLGIDELLEDDAIVLVEWGEKFASIQRRAAGEIVMESEGGDGRKISVKLRQELQQSA